MEEWKQAASHIGVKDEVSEQLFRKLDDDGSGWLTMHEFSEALIELAALDPEEFGRAANRMFMRALTEQTVRRKAEQIKHSKNFRRMVAQQNNVDESTLIETRQDDLVRMRQRKKEMKDFRQLLAGVQGGKFRDPGNFESQNWKSVDEVLEAKEIDICSKRDFKPDHVSQGELGDCYFLTSLTVMATRPGLVQKLLLTNKYNPQGIYKVRFCKDGRWKVITVSDSLPLTE